jgi:plasmid maintenance system antidote protein VapI
MNEEKLMPVHPGEMLLEEFGSTGSNMLMAS